jgi:putative glutamine amidotransferase
MGAFANMIRKPLIGLTTTRMPNPAGRPAFGINEPYVKSVLSAGGIPVLIPLDLSNEDLDILLKRLNGILFTGGYDVDPHLYESTPKPTDEGVDVARDRLEVHLLHKLVQTYKPFLGICRGCQVINVALGGSLYQHLPDQLPGDLQHDQHGQPRNYLAHRVTIEPDSSLAQIFNDEQVWVNSLHHQGVQQLASHLQAIAVAPDGLVEAFELQGFPFALAVQWHPEELQEHEGMRKLFHAFIQACQQSDSAGTKQDRQ